MTKPNFLEMAKQNLKEFSWPVWFPYPKSWFKTLVLVPLALPTTHFLIFGLTGVIVSIIENNHLLLLFSVLFGLFIPVVILAFFYNFIWYIWNKRKSKSYLSKLIPGILSIWEALYTIFVLVFSFTIVVSIFSELAFLDCRTSQLNICTGRFTERIVNLILSSIESKTFFFRPWFIVWIFTTSYLYQLELILKKSLTNSLKLLLKNKYKKAGTEFESQVLQDNLDIKSNKKRDKQQDTRLTANQQYYQQPKKRKLVKLIFTFLVLVGGGTYLYTKFPEMKSNVTLYISSPNISPRIKPHSDILQKAFSKAISAANLIKPTNSQKKWQSTVTQWQAAIALMKTVQSSSPNDEIAQQKISDYKKKLGDVK